MTYSLRPRFLQRRYPIVLGACLLLGGLLTSQVVSRLNASDEFYRYPFAQPERQDVTGQLEQELAFYKTRVNQSPDDGLDRAALATVYLRLARATGDANWYLLAEQSAQQSLANLPFNNSGALLAQAKVAEAKHDFDQAISLAEQVLELNAYNEDALAILVTSHLGKGDIDQASNAAQRLVDIVPTLGTYTLKALVNIAQGETVAAIQHFQLALAAEEPEEAGSSAWARTLMGRFYASQGEVQQAQQLYQEALRILPRYPLALIHLAQLETRQGNYRAADRLYSQVFIARDYPNILDHVAIQGMADVELLRGNRDRAETLWQEAEMLFRQHQDLSTFGHRRELARLLLARGRAEDLPEALSLMEADLQVRRDVETLDTYAWALGRAGRWEEAQVVLQEALSSGVQHARILYRAGQGAAQLGDVKQSEMYLNQAREIDPTFDQKAQKLWGLT